jgi:DNA-binding CsgD family transcriptional regulator
LVNAQGILSQDFVWLDAKLLTAREKDILCLMVKSLTNQAIAVVLMLSPGV